MNPVETYLRELRKLDPDAGHLEVTAGWGHAGTKGVTMPGKGKVVGRDYSDDERAAIAAGAKSLGLSVKDAFACLGETTCDIYLNNVAYWRNVPAKVWDYTIGGYQSSRSGFPTARKTYSGAH